jgi:protein-tyrosine-phosphatase
VDIALRARRHAALGDPIRLAIVDDLATSDRAPKELSARHGVPSNLLAHHLEVLEGAGLIERLQSSGDRRRRYVRLRPEGTRGLGISVRVPTGPVLFVCTHNSARSQLAAAVWEQEVGSRASSAGTHPAARVHPGAVEAASRSGIDLSHAIPRSFDDLSFEPAWIVTVCDQAHEELVPGDDWLHWSTPDPVGDAAPDAFDLALNRIRHRIRTLTEESNDE